MKQCFKKCNNAHIQAIQAEYLRALFMSLISSNLDAFHVLCLLCLIPTIIPFHLCSCMKLLNRRNVVMRYVYMENVVLMEGARLRGLFQHVTWVMDGSQNTQSVLLLTTLTNHKDGYRWFDVVYQRKTSSGLLRRACKKKFIKSK